MKIAMTQNTLYYGDNLDVLERHIAAESVDLVYLDPPFNSNASYNVLFAEHNGKQAAAQIKAFEDTWRWDESAAEAYLCVVEGGGKVSLAMQAFRTLLGNSNMLAYLAMMAPRLVELRRVLKPTGSIYLHCDPTASHYLKLLMDAVFGPQNYKNEITWKRANAHNDPKRFGRISDCILFYSKSEKFIWNTQHTEYRDAYYESHYKKDQDGRFYRTVPLDAPKHGEGSIGLLYEWKGKWPAKTRTWSIIKEKMEDYEARGLIRYTRTGTPTLLQYADEMAGVPLQNIWTDIPPVNPQAFERQGYPTQKPVALLERIIKASSNEGDVVLDPFCVRKGTGVWTCLPPCSPPVNGGTKTKPETDASFPLHVDGEGRGGVIVSLPDVGEGRGGVIVSLPDVGEGRGGVLTLPITLKPIETLIPGDYVLTHDSKPHKVLRTITKIHHGTMLGIKHHDSPAILWVTDEHCVLCKKRTISLGGKRDWSHIKPEHFARAREMRRELTNTEQVLWGKIRKEQLGVKFRRQHPIGPYIPDFYCWEAGLIVEVDGDSHFIENGPEYDTQRDAYLKSLGLKVLRFTNNDVKENLIGVVSTIISALKAVEASDNHYREWRRADTLEIGDTVYFGDELKPVHITEILTETTEEEVYDLEVEDAHSFLTEVCAVHNCGCGTTIVAAQKLGRRWIGIDITHLAINLMKNRLKIEFGTEIKYRVIGEPKALPDAEQLANSDPYQFQWWALGLVGARPADQKKGSDKGIDGRLFFHDEAAGGKTKQVIFSVKAGHTTSAHVRDLVGVIDREKAEIGVLITFQEPTSHMRSEAAGSGFYDSPGWGKRYPRIQILTIAELLAGKGVEMPPLGQVNITLPRGSKAKGRKKGAGMEEMV